MYRFDISIHNSRGTIPGFCGTGSRNCLDVKSLQNSQCPAIARSSPAIAKSGPAIASLVKILSADNLVVFEL